MDEYYQYQIKSGGSAWVHLADHWNKVDFTKLTLLLSAGMLRLCAVCLAAAPSAVAFADLALECAKHSRWLLSFGALACTARLFAALSLQQDMGVLFLSVLFMMRDIGRFLAMLALVATGFGLCMAGVINSSSFATPDASPWQPFLAPLWAIHGHVLGYDDHLLDFPRPLSVALWVYFLLSQVVLLNLLIAIMGDTWQRVKDSADEEWKFLLVQDMEEFFDLYPTPPPFNVLLLLGRLHDHFARGAALAHSGERRGPYLSSSDIKKKSKVAQHDLLRKQALLEARSTDAQLAGLAATQADAAAQLAKVADASARTDVRLAQLAMQNEQLADALAHLHALAAAENGADGPATTPEERAKKPSSLDRLPLLRAPTMAMRGPGGAMMMAQRGSMRFGANVTSPQPVRGGFAGAPR